MLTLLMALAASHGAAVAETGPAVTFQPNPGRLQIHVNGEPFADYVYEDANVLRPFFCDVIAPSGVQVTRNHPPDPVADNGNDDHADFHPGVWLAFGDLGGADFWRNKARVRHVRFVSEPQEGAAGTFAVLNAYETLDTPPKLICEETCVYAIFASDSERWLLTESTFRAAAPDISFGDQEEMGLGVRLATQLTVRHGSGTILNSRGGVDEEGTWGQAADWCSYSGMVDGERTGAVLMASPGNFRASWFHNRDYGLMVANPFAKKAMTGPDDPAVGADATPLPQDGALSLGFGVCVFSTDSEAHPDYAALYAQYLKRREAGAAPPQR